MNVPKIDIKQLLEAGVHLGHKTLRWNPKMKEYIFGEKNSIHIIDLTQTVDFIKNALVQVHKTIAGGGKLLVVSTKKQAAEQVSDLAKETGQYFVNYRWLGGMLTNWNTIQNSIRRLKKLDSQLSKENLGFTKKELLKFGKEKDKLTNNTSQQRVNIRKILSLEDMINKPYSKVTIELKENHNIEEIKNLLQFKGQTQINLIINDKNKKIHYNLENLRKLDLNQLKMIKSKEYVKKITV